MGGDEIPNEFLTRGGPRLLEALTRIFKMIHKEEIIPKEWTEEKVSLIHKGKSRKSLDNYRGIAKSSNVSKLFTRIWAARLEKVVESKDMLGEIQGGFRKGRSTVDFTVDHVFVLMNMIERAHKRPNTSLYVAFVDLRKAFDTVWREGLWATLESKGLGGKFMRVVQGLYKNHRKCIQVPGGSTNWIQCERGVRQGCVLSPLLFACLWSGLMALGGAVESVLGPGLVWVAYSLMVGGAGIMLVSSVLVPMAIRGAERRERRVGESVAVAAQLIMECPDCCHEQSFSLGAARCKACGFTMTIDLEEPRCVCGFLLYRLEGDRCPECGRAVQSQ